MYERYYFTVPNLGEYYIELWFLLTIVFGSLLLMLVLGTSIFVLVKKNKRAKEALPKKKKSGKKQKAPVVKQEYSAERMQEVLDAAPKITAWQVEGEECDPLCDLAQVSYPEDTHEWLMETCKQEKAYKAWCEEQSALYEEQVKARRAYFKKNNYGCDCLEGENRSETERPLTAAEQRNERAIKKQNDKRVAKALKLKAQEEAAEAKAQAKQAAAEQKQQRKSKRRSKH